MIFGLRIRGCATITSLLKVGLPKTRLPISGFRTAAVDQSSESKWRSEQGLPVNRNAFGPLTNLPDFTYLDGRPTPLGSRQRQRVLQQRETAKRIVTLTRELDMAKERLPILKRQLNEKREEELSLKLKPKGYKLLKN